METEKMRSVMGRRLNVALCVLAASSCLTASALPPGGPCPARCVQTYEARLKTRQEQTVDMTVDDEEALAAEWADVVSKLEIHRYEAISDPYLGAFEEGEVGEFEIDLEDRYDYVIAAFCDVDCSNLDLDVLGPDGVSVGQDLEADERPRVYFRPSVSGPFTVGVRMAECARSSCFAAIGLFSRVPDRRLGS